MKTAIAGLLLIVTVSASQQTRTFAGVISDDMCAKGDHSPMRMGPTDAECTKACVMAHDAKYVLKEGQNVYTLSDQKTPETFAAQKVRVLGTLDAKTRTIRVSSITAAE